MQGKLRVNDKSLIKSDASSVRIKLREVKVHTGEENGRECKRKREIFSDKDQVEPTKEAAG